MNQLTCELCGGNDLVKEGGFFVCQHCGTKYSVEEAKKMMIEGTVSVKVDNSEKMEKIYTLARRARDEGNNANAAKYYQEIVEENPNDWEAAFYSVYCAEQGCTLNHLVTAISRVSSAAQTALELIVEQNPEPSEERTNMLYEIGDNTLKFARLLRTFAHEHYSKYINVNGTWDEFKNRAYQTGMACCKLGDFFYGIDDKRAASIYYKNAGSLWTGCYVLNDVALERIREYEPDYQPPQPKKAGCYVATCVYGSYDCPQVWTLRRYRDNTLGATWYGRAFIRTYYAISPTLVKWFGNTSWFKKMWKGKLDRMVKKLQDQGVESTPYNDKNW